jgi:hypothetical protein
MAVAKRYRVTLTAEERDDLRRMISRGKADARKLAHARILLHADEAEGGPARVDEEIASALDVSVRTIERVRQRFVEQGLAAALLPKPSQRIYARKLDGGQGVERRSAPPAGAGLRPAARGQGALVAAPAGGAHSRAGARGRALARDGAADAQQNELKPHLRKMGCIPPKQSAEFVYHMEDVREVYHRPYDPRHRVGCLDETFTQLIGESRELLPAAPGRVERYDCVYARTGRGPRQAWLGGVGAPPACSWPSSRSRAGGTWPPPRAASGATGRRSSGRCSTGTMSARRRSC